MFHFVLPEELVTFEVLWLRRKRQSSFFLRVSIVSAFLVGPPPRGIFHGASGSTFLPVSTACGRARS